MPFDFNAFTTIVAAGFAQALKEDMDEHGVGNYVAFDLSTEGGDKYLAMFTRMPDGKTPMELHAVAMAENAELRAYVDRLRTTLAEVRDDPIIGDYIDLPMRRFIDRALSPNATDNRREASGS